ncbi:MAG: hypothetical protein K9N46_01025 [Candidatus Marinimicrobia bacterium]|nr:hypothetical protein [Candidatus Neomarinimicrobiota bacterium]MCF7827941.1 hypothetical protein [Candidatus Neomarinimicrobiota bacterium]MCF7879304.1 hypothetical protein [Candidatus Neomarinimicrobiota bacterium]
MRGRYSVNWKRFTSMIALVLISGFLFIQCDESTTGPSTTVEDIKSELQKYTDVSQVLQDG